MEKHFKPRTIAVFKAATLPIIRNLDLNVPLLLLCTSVYRSHQEAACRECSKCVAKLFVLEVVRRYLFKVRPGESALPLRVREPVTLDIRPLSSARSGRYRILVIGRRDGFSTRQWRHHRKNLPTMFFGLEGKRQAEPQLP